MRAICVFAMAVLPLAAREAAPVFATITTTHAPRSGVSSDVRIVVEAGEPVEGVQFRFLPTAMWKMDGTSDWTLTMKRGETRELTTRAIPLGDDAGPLEGEVIVPGWGPSIFDLKVRPPGPASGARRSPAFASAAQPRESVVNVSFQGRIVFTNSQGQQEGLRRATIKVKDIDLTTLRSCGSDAITDDQGNWAFSGSCGDLGAGDGPDLFFDVLLESSQIDMHDSGCAIPLVIYDYSGGFRNLGTVPVVSSCNAAAQAYSTLVEGADFMAINAGESVPKVKVIFPEPATEYSRSLDRIRLKQADATNRGVVLHMYGHHILHEMAESPAPDVDVSACESLAPVNTCLWSPKSLEVAWTEGWPDFFAGQVLAFFGLPLGTASFETHVDAGFSGQEDRIPGFIAAILTDLADVTDDDQHNDGAGRRDDTIFTFRMLWDVVKNYDPSGSILHDNPITIHEFWSGMRVFQQARINQVSEIYREHHIVKPQPDLLLTSLANPPATASRNSSFVLNWTVRNLGNEVSHFVGGLAFTLITGTQSFNLSANVFPAFPLDFAAGGTHAGSSVVGVVSTVPPGTYLLRACIDSTGSSPESDESNNCTVAATGITIQ